ncbi:MAG: hypothetical protein ACRDPY_12010 [Streptosporangiaceae bacterium]
MRVASSPAVTGMGTPAAAAPGRRPWRVWVIPSVSLFVLLCARNRFLFTDRLYEQGDSAANSILIAQAKHFTLLVGNYSREGFNHPGPAYMYVQAFGEYLFQNWLHVVPTPWNAHVLAVFALNGAFTALAVGIVYGWTGSLRGAAACLAVIVAFAIAHPSIVNSDWMPYMYVPAYVVFVIAAGSVAAGRLTDAWILALSGWFLIHGQACFLLFVPVLALTVLAALGWPRRRRLPAAARSFFATRRGVWVPVAAISAVFLLPIVVNLVLHWPGDFGKYISYGHSAQAGENGFGRVVAYALWYWWPYRLAWLAPVLLLALALAAILLLTRGPLRGFLLALLAVNVVSTLTFLFYAAVGIDTLEQYIGYFYWSAPLVMVLIIAVAAMQSLSLRLGTVVAVAAAVAAVTMLAVIPGTRTGTNDVDESLPSAVAAVAARAPGRPIVLHLDHRAWPEAVGFLVQAKRTGVRACIDDPWYTFIVTSQFICTPAQASAGKAYWFYTPRVPVGARVLARLHGVAVAAPPS